MVVFKGFDRIQRELFEKCGASVGVVFEDSKPIGTGVFVKINGKQYFITAKHVVNLPILFNKLRINYGFMESKGEESSLLNLDVVFVEHDNDIAFVDIPDEFKIDSYDNEDNQYQITDKVLMWGCPTGITEKEEAGLRLRLVNLITDLISNDNYLRLRIDHNTKNKDEILKSLGGISGGPVFNSYGDLIGINKRQRINNGVITDVESTPFENCHISKYKDTDLREKILWEIPYLVHLEFTVIYMGKEKRCCFQALIGIDINDTSTFDCWLSFNQIAVLNGEEQTLKIRSVDHSYATFLYKDEDILTEDDKASKGFTKKGEEKLKELSVDTAFLMLFGDTENKQTIKESHFNHGTVGKEIFDSYVFNFGIIPRMRHKDVEK